MLATKFENELALKLESSSVFVSVAVASATALKPHKYSFGVLRMGVLE